MLYLSPIPAIFTPIYSSFPFSDIYNAAITLYISLVELLHGFSDSCVYLDIFAAGASI